MLRTGEGGLETADDHVASGAVVEAVRDLVQQIDKALTVRRLYSAHAGPYQEAMHALERKLWKALEASDGFTLRLAADRLLVGETVLIERPVRDDCFFFPAYRDGLRELTFATEIEPRELEALLSVFEAERLRRLAPDEDLVAYLWRCDLDGIRFAAVDGIGDEEGEGGVALPGEDFRALVADLVEKIGEPALPVTGQSYAFVLDADVRLGATDLRYDATTARRAFQDNPTVFHLTREQADALRAEVRREDEADLLGRFVAILLAMATDGQRTVERAPVLRVLRQLLGSLWQASEHEVLVDTLQRLHAAVEGAAEPASRAALAELLHGFFTPDRLGEVFRMVREASGVSVAAARRLWDLAGDEAWGPLLDFLHELGEGDLAAEVRKYLRTRIAARPELLRGALSDPRPERVLTALSLLDPRVESLFARELLGLVEHRSEPVRLKAVAAAGRLGGREAQETLWRVLHDDPGYQVRLLAFRLLEGADRDALVARLSALVSEPCFRDRPIWERRKAAQMLAQAMGSEAAPLFAEWLPRRRFFLGRDELETGTLAVELLRDCGQAGRDVLGRLAAGRGKLARLAAQALAGGPR